MLFISVPEELVDCVHILSSSMPILNVEPLVFLLSLPPLNCRAPEPLTLGTRHWPRLPYRTHAKALNGHSVPSCYGAIPNGVVDSGALLYLVLLLWLLLEKGLWMGIRFTKRVSNYVQEYKCIPLLEYQVHLVLTPQRTGCCLNQQCGLPCTT